MDIKHILFNQHFAAPCAHTTNFLAFPPWYKYLSCTGSGAPQLTNIDDVWKIVAAVIEILLRVAAIAAVGIIIYAGIQYTTSQGNPEQTGKALNTIISAAVGLAICILASVVVAFVAGSIS